MPVYLAALTRRQFLGRSIAVGAGLMAAPNLLEPSKETDENTWALLSDIHLAADRQLIERGTNMADNFKKVSRELLALAKRPAAVMVCGDCAFNSGESGDYAVVADLLTPIRAGQMPIHLALGNHDNRDRFWEAFPKEKAAGGPVTDRQAALVQTPRFNWFILDSLEQTNSTPGLLGKEQRDWLGQALDAHPDKPAVVMIHHNPGIEGGNMGLKDTLLLFDIIRPRRQVKAYIYGHTHHWQVERDPSGIHLINLPPVAYVFQPGEPSGWVRATVGAKGIALELRCVDTSHKAHGQVVRLDWRA